MAWECTQPKTFLFSRMENAALPTANYSRSCIKSNIRKYYLLASTHFIKITTHSSRKVALCNRVKQLF